MAERERSNDVVIEGFFSFNEITRYIIEKGPHPTGIELESDKDGSKGTRREGIFL